MDVNQVIKTFLRKKAVWCPEELFPKVREILWKKIQKGQIKHYGWRVPAENGCYWLAWTEWHTINNQVCLAA